MVAGGIALAKKAKQTNASKAQDLSSANSDEERDRLFKESGLSEDFRDRWNSAWSSYNPNLIQDTFWDQTSNFFGARSNADVSRLEMLQKRNDALNQLVNQKGEQDYNSEAEQMARLRSAGVNPDLQGGVDPSQATEGHEPEQPISFSGLSTGADVAQGFSKAFMTALSLTQGVTALKGNLLDLSNKRLGAFNATQNLAYQLFKSHFDQLDVLQPYSDGAFANVFQMTDDELRKYGIRSSRERKLIKHHMDELQHSFEGKIREFGSIEDYYNSRDKAVLSKTKWYHGNDPFDDEDVENALRAWFKYTHDIEEKELQLEEKNIKAGKNKADYVSKYYGGLNPTKAFQSENDANEFRSYVIKKKKQLYDKLVDADDPSMFSLMLAVQLMGDVDLLGNSGAKDVAGAVADFYNPVKKIAKVAP